VLIGQLPKTRPLGQRQHRDQATRRHEIRLVEHRRRTGQTVRGSHPRGALRVESVGVFANPNLPARKGILALRHAYLAELTPAHRWIWAKAVAKITDDLEELLAFYDYPAEHWVHLRTTNPIESTFSTVMHRTKVTRGAGSKAAGLAMAFKLIMAAQDRWRAVNAPHLVALVRAGATFVKGNSPNEKKINKQSRRPSRLRPDQDRSTGIDGPNRLEVGQRLGHRWCISVGSAARAAAVGPQLALELDARTCRAQYDRTPLEGGPTSAAPVEAALSRRPLRG
jgi:Transposase, Mutator family